MFALLLIVACSDGGTDSTSNITTDSGTDSVSKFVDNPDKLPSEFEANTIFGLFELTPVQLQRDGQANEGYFEVATFGISYYPYQGATESGQNCYLTETEELIHVSGNVYGRESDGGVFEFSPEYIVPPVVEYSDVLTITAPDKYDIDNDGDTTEIVDTYHRMIVTFDASDVPACV